MSSPLTTTIDSLLEGTIVGSFTKIGPAVRRRLRSWDPVTTDMTGKRVVLTGGTSGIGQAAATELARLGADVVITSRDLERASSAAEEIEAEVGTDHGSVEGLELDTADFDSVLELVSTVRLGAPVDVLIHNAGALTDEYRTAPSGLELTLASHLVGPYLLTKELRSHLAPGARVLWMSSGGMYTQGLDIGKLEMGEDAYRGAIAYARAKRAQVELATALAPEWAPGVVMHTMHPGWVDTPGVDQGLPGFRTVMGPLLREPEGGADTLVWLAATGGGDAAPGSFFLDRHPRRTVYLPGTGTDDAERARLIDWLELVTLPATVES